MRIRARLGHTANGNVLHTHGRVPPTLPVHAPLRQHLPRHSAAGRRPQSRHSPALPSTLNPGPSFIASVAFPAEMSLSRLLLPLKPNFQPFKAEKPKKVSTVSTV